MQYGKSGLEKKMNTFLHQYNAPGHRAEMTIIEYTRTF